MSAAFRLLRLSLKRVRTLLGATGFLLAFVQVLRVRIAAMLQNDSHFELLASLLPPSVRAILGSALASVMSVNGIVCAVFFDTGFIVALLALTITLATQPASEMETGFADLILARPMPRHWLVTRTIALVLLSILLMLWMILVGTWAGLAMFAPPDVAWPSARETGSLALYLAVLLLCWSGIALALGSACRRGVAGATTALLAFAALLLDWAHRLWPALGPVAWLSPFSYYSPYDMVAGKPLPMGDLLVLGAIAITGFTAAYFIISRRDISR